ncbi:hypothetical protein JW960_08670, partial [candidate division KSB1 bacterium]|nr:hypothetical protein [candidate division KSB1 bacterium]
FWQKIKYVIQASSLIASWKLALHFWLVQVGYNKIEFKNQLFMNKNSRQKTSRRWIAKWMDMFLFNI